MDIANVREAIQRTRAGIAINITTKTQFGEWTEIIQQLQIALREGGVQRVDMVYRAFVNADPRLADDDVETLYRGIELSNEELKRIDGFPYIGDLGLAEAIAYVWRNHIRYVNGIGWLIWSGKRWRIDPANVIVQSAKVVVRARQAAVSQREVPAGDEKTLERKAADYRASLFAEKRGRIVDAIKIAETDESLVIDSKRLDNADHLLACANGVINLLTGELLPPMQGQYITQMTNISYYPDAQCPRWEQFISELMNGNADMIEYIQRVCGYLLTGYTREQAFWILYGIGANGKSTFLNTLAAVLGDFASNTPFKTFEADGNSPTGDDIARLRGKRLVYSLENEERKSLNESRIKAVTGGDKITARFLYGTYFEFMPKFKLILAVNHKPIITGTDRGIWRRVKLIPFMRTFEKNPDQTLDVKLLAELPGILRWMVDGAVKWAARGMHTPRAVLEQTEAYQSEMDTIGNFLSEHVEAAEFDRVKSMDIYKTYQEWAIENGLRPLSNIKFSKSLQERGIKKERLTSGWHWVGIRMNQ